MSRPCVALGAILLAATTACVPLRWPEPESTATASPSPSTSPTASPATSPTASPAASQANADPPDAASAGDASSDDARPADDGRPWYELVRLAREAQREGELGTAGERLAQAELQVESLAADSAPRRTVFGRQCRLAEALARAGDSDGAAALTGRLIETARAEPAIAGPALVQLVQGALARRDDVPTEERLDLLAVALRAAASEGVDRQRLQLALEISGTARIAGRLELARRAIEQARSDARTLRPADDRLHAAIALERARIALEQHDLDTAEEASIAANRLFEQTEARPDLRALGEITLARALAERGGEEDRERARRIARVAEARLDEEPPLDDHPRRVVLWGLARIDVETGRTGEALARLRSALAVPPVDTEGDRRLVARLEQELAALTAAFEADEGTEPGPPAPDEPRADEDQSSAARRTQSRPSDLAR